MGEGKPMKLLNRKHLGPPGTPLPPNAVYIGRRNLYYRMPQSKWASPFTGRDAVPRYRERLLATPEQMAALPELHGKDLVCWCAPRRPCHGEVLMELLEAADG
jgi:uncharacterized protein DUF4326